VETENSKGSSKPFSSSLFFFFFIKFSYFARRYTVRDDGEEDLNDLAFAK